MTPEQLDLACWPIFHSMTQHGIAVDTNKLEELREEVRVQVRDTRTEIDREAGDVEPSSPKSVSEWMKKQNLFGKRTKSGQMATGERDLAFYNNPTLNKVIEWRGLNKLLNTFIGPTLEKSLEDPIEGTSLAVIHPRWRVTRVKSGRVSMEDPNLLAFPSRDEMGKKVRACFVPRPGNAFVAGDYSQLEPRIVAALSTDAKLCDIYARGLDIYTQTGIDLTISRTAAKIVTLGVLYGMQAKRLMEQLTLAGSVTPDGKPLYDEEACQRLIEAWFDTYPGVRVLVSSVVAQARNNGGWATTHHGRGRYLPALFLPGNRYPNEKLRQEAERQAFNHRIQGTGMEYLKMAMLKLRERTFLQPVLAIHDELIYEVDDSLSERSQDYLRADMHHTLNGVELKVTTVAGDSWAALKG